MPGPREQAEAGARHEGQQPHDLPQGQDVVRALHQHDGAVDVGVVPGRLGHHRVTQDPPVLRGAREAPDEGHRLVRGCAPAAGAQEAEHDGPQARQAHHVVGDPVQRGVAEPGDAEHRRLVGPLRGEGESRGTDRDDGQRSPSPGQLEAEAAPEGDAEDVRGPDPLAVDRRLDGVREGRDVRRDVPGQGRRRPVTGQVDGEDVVPGREGGEDL